VTACRPEDLSAALGLPGDAVLCPWGVLALGWPGSEQPEGSGTAPKPALDEMYFAGGWGRPLSALVP
jgi:hypothetical protein